MFSHSQICIFKEQNTDEDNLVHVTSGAGLFFSLIIREYRFACLPDTAFLLKTSPPMSL